MKALAWVAAAVVGYLELWMVSSIFFSKSMDDVSITLWCIILYSPALAFPIAYLVKNK